MWASTGGESWTYLYHPLARLLFQVGFIGFAQSPGGAVVYSYENPDFANGCANLELTKEFVIHPAYRMTLNVQTAYIRPGVDN
jgi:hypothetical protein